MIRKIKRSEIEKVYPYVLEIFTAMEIPALKKLDKKLLKNIIIHAMHHPRYRYGYEHAWICEREGQIAGVFFAYPSEWERLIDGPLEASMLEHELAIDTIIQEHESMPGEWYLDTLVTDSKFRRQGVGQEMLEAADQIAIDRGYKKISLNCEVDNLPAYALYQKMGYSKKTKIVLSQHLYHHMVKEL